MTVVAIRGAQGEPAPVEIRDALAALVQERGETEVIRWCGLGRQTIARIMGGLPVRSGTVAQIRLRLGNALPDGTHPD